MGKDARNRKRGVRQGGWLEVENFSHHYHELDARRTLLLSRYSRFELMWLYSERLLGVIFGG